MSFSLVCSYFFFFFFFFQAEDGIRDPLVTGVQTCALPIWSSWSRTPIAPSFSNREGQVSAAASGTARRGPSTPCSRGGPRSAGDKLNQIGRASCRERVETTEIERCTEKNKTSKWRNQGSEE